MNLVTFGIDNQRNLIVQFPVFVHPHNQQHPAYQLETVPVPIVDENEKAQSYIHLQVRKPYITLNSRDIYYLEDSGIRNMQKNWL